MKRCLLLLIALVLLLAGCTAEDPLHSFERGADGFVDKTTGIRYREAEACFEAASAGKTVGQCLGSLQVLYTFYEIPDLDGAVYLTDDYGTVYYADGADMDASLWTVDTVLVCRTVGEMDEVKKNFGDKDAATVAAIRDAWFLGEDLGADVFLLEDAVSFYPVKMGSADYPNLYYAIELRFTADGTAYLTDKYGKQTVKLDGALAARMCGEG